VAADNLNASADLQARSESSNAFFIVLAESREDLDGWNLERHSRGTVGKLIATVGLPEVLGPAKITANGYPGLQYEFTGSSDGTRVTYVHTTLETPKQYVQVLMWCPRSLFEKNKPVFQKILNSFKELS
jgi:hypothetical protein